MPGQSQGARLVATAPIYKEVVEAFVEKVRALEQGAAKDNYFCGPVINEKQPALPTADDRKKELGF